MAGKTLWSNCRPSCRSRSACASHARCLRPNGPKWRMTRSAGSWHQNSAMDHGGRLGVRPSSAALGRSTTTEQERSSPEIWRTRSPRQWSCLPSGEHSLVPPGKRGDHWSITTRSRRRHRAMPRRQRVIAVIIEAGRPQVGAELLGAASVLAGAIDARVHALSFDDAAVASLGELGADEVTHFVGSDVAEDAAAAVVEWSAEQSLWAVLGPSTAFGREVLGRMAAALGAGLVGDAIGLEIADGDLIAAKPAFSGALVADISCISPVRMVSVRPGVLPVPPRRPHAAAVSVWPMEPRGRVRVVSRRRDDDVEVLARAEMVIGVGAAVPPDEYALLSPLAALLRCRVGGHPEGHRQRLGATLSAGWHHRSEHCSSSLRGVGPEWQVQPRGRSAGRRHHSGHQP